jgi:myosin heavy subunit
MTSGVDDKSPMVFYEPEVADTVWVPHPTILWQPAEVILVSPDQRDMTVLLPDSETELHTFPASSTLSFDPDHGKNWDDAMSMANVNEAAVLSLIRRRFTDQKKIYTFTGDVLLSVNPCATIDGLYDVENVDTGERAVEKGDKAVQAALSTGARAAAVRRQFESVRQAGEPHVYTVAHRAYQAMLTSSYKQRSQSILINGESGAGKTEACKYVMRHLAHISERKRAELKKKAMESFAAATGGGGGSHSRFGMGLFKKRGRAGGRGRAEAAATPKAQPRVATGADASEAPTVKTQLERLLLLTNPLLEAFGNSKTIRNHNSSRYVSCMRLGFCAHTSTFGNKFRSIERQCL